MIRGFVFAPARRGGRKLGPRMFIPIRTDYRMAHRPWVNYGLIAINVLVFVAGLNDNTAAGRQAIIPWMLDPDSPHLAQFFTSVFLHAGWDHLLGNMVFLWVFGNALNDRLGHVAYLAFYLAGGVLAGVGYVLISGTGPVLGASGAIAAVTGAYLVLFARVRILILIVLYFITTVQVSSLLFVGFEVAYNVVLTAIGHGGGVAYAAHSSGYIFGIAVALAVQALRLVPSDELGLMHMLRHVHRRQQYQRMVAQGYSPFQGTGPAPAIDRDEGTSRWVEVRTVDRADGDTPSAREMTLRREIASACLAHDLPLAAEKYLQLVQIADDAVLTQQNQLDVANQLMAGVQYPAAADAYERLLRHYPHYENAADIYLMLGLLYGRYLHQYDRAEQYLTTAMQGLHDSSKRAMAQQELQALQDRREL